MSLSLIKDTHAVREYANYRICILIKIHVSYDSIFRISATEYIYLDIIHSFLFVPSLIALTLGQGRNGLS